jgi:hypothetical protein
MRKDDERKLDHATLEALCGCHCGPGHMTLAMLALAFLAGLHARLRPFEGGADWRRFRHGEQKESLRHHPPPHDGKRGSRRDQRAGVGKAAHLSAEATFLRHALPLGLVNLATPGPNTPTTKNKPVMVLEAIPVASELDAG